MQSIAKKCMESNSVRDVEEGTIDSTTYLLLTTANNPAEGRDRRESVFGFMKNGKNDIKMEI